MITSIFVEARYWHDKTGGASYFTARISVNGKLVGVLPFQYGYENHHETMAVEWLKEQGFITHPSFTHFWQLQRIYDVAVYSVRYNTTKAEAKRFVAHESDKTLSANRAELLEVRPALAR